MDNYQVPETSTSTRSAPRLSIIHVCLAGLRAVAFAPILIFFFCIVFFFFPGRNSSCYSCPKSTTPRLSPPSLAIGTLRHRIQGQTPAIWFVHNRICRTPGALFAKFLISAFNKESRLSHSITSITASPFHFLFSIHSHRKARQQSWVFRPCSGGLQTSILKLLAL